MWSSIDLTSKIMREMSTSPSQWNVRPSYVGVARKLGVDEETVRNRLRMMKEMGFLQGWRLIVNARLLGMESSNMLFEFPSADAKETAIPHIRRSDGVVLIQNFYGDALQMTIFHERDADLVKDFDRVLIPSRARAPKIVTRWKVRLPPCDLKPRRIDLKIIRLLLTNAERKYPEVARELGISARTVKRRMNRMMGSSAFFMQPLLDLRKARGVTPCQLLVRCSPDKKRAVDTAIGSKSGRILRGRRGSRARSSHPSTGGSSRPYS